MKLIQLMTAVLALTAASAMAADAKSAAAAKKRILLDLSSEALMDKATAQATMAEVIPEKLWKIYPASKWGFVSQVEGGLTSGGTCVVTFTAAPASAKVMVASAFMSIAASIS